MQYASIVRTLILSVAAISLLEMPLPTKFLGLAFASAEIGILQIKKARISEPGKRKNVYQELEALSQLRAALPELF